LKVRQAPDEVMRKPLLAAWPEYHLRTAVVTSQEYSLPTLVPTLVVAPSPALPGALLQVTPVSVQLEAARDAVIEAPLAPSVPLSIM
jgi:hypothetical protein